jgi:hypothetical protein
MTMPPMSQDGVEIHFDQKRGYLELACEPDAFAPYREIAREQLKEFPDISIDKVMEINIVAELGSLAIIMGVMPLNNPQPTNWRGMLNFGIRMAAGIVAVGCFLTGLYWAFRHPSQGLLLMGIGIVVGILFGGVPARATQARNGKK